MYLRQGVWKVWLSDLVMAIGTGGGIGMVRGVILAAGVCIDAVRWVYPGTSSASSDLERSTATSIDVAESTLVMVDTFDDALAVGVAVAAGDDFDFTVSFAIADF